MRKLQLKIKVINVGDMIRTKNPTCCLIIKTIVINVYILLSSHSLHMYPQ